jgi:mannose-6-phosphate isomerase-like protein (cupin superfamily)
MSDKIFTKKEFEGLKKLRFHGKISEGVDAELYWINCMDGDDAVFSQTIRTHTHDFFEIHFVLSGRITYTVGDKRLAAENGTFLIIPDSAPHTVDSYSADMLKVSVAV